MTSLQERLQQMLNRSMMLCGLTTREKADGTLEVVDLDKANKEFLQMLCKMEPDPKEQAKMLIEAWEAGEKSDKMLTLNALRVEQVSNYIASESVFMSAFFEQRTLQPDEEPYWTNETRNEIRIRSMGEDGKPEQVRVLKPMQKHAVALHLLVSDKVSYKILDLYRGRVDGVVNKTFDIASDLRFKKDRVCYDLLNATVANGGAYGAFSTEQAYKNKAARIYMAHSGIVSGHLPTTNDIVDGADTTTRFTVRYYDPATTPPTGLRPAVLLAIDDYCNSWGTHLPMGGRLVPTGEIITPACDIINIAKIFLPSGGTALENRVAEEINRVGYTSLTGWGRTWKFIPDVTIESGTCFPRMNLLPGIVWNKPSFDREYVKVNEEDNEETRWQRHAYGAAIISQLRVRGLRITYLPAE